MQKAIFAFGPLDGYVKNLPNNARRYRDGLTDTIYVPAPCGIEWSIGKGRPAPTRHYITQPTLWVPKGESPDRIHDLGYGYAALLVYADLLFRVYSLTRPRPMINVDQSSLLREKRRLRSQLARPYDEKWEERYLSIAVYHATTKSGNGVLLIESPYEHKESAIRAGLDKLTPEQIFVRDGERRKTETIVHVTSGDDTGVLE